jgi:hypothetical protein
VSVLKELKELIDQNDRYLADQAGRWCHESVEFVCPSFCPAGHVEVEEGFSNTDL